MPVLVGMIFGALLTIGAAFAYDSTTGRSKRIRTHRGWRKSAYGQLEGVPCYGTEWRLD